MPRALSASAVPLRRPPERTMPAPRMPVLLIGGGGWCGHRRGGRGGPPLEQAATIAALTSSAGSSRERRGVQGHRRVSVVQAGVQGRIRPRVAERFPASLTALPSARWPARVGPVPASPVRRRRRAGCCSSSTVRTRRPRDWFGTSPVSRSRSGSRDWDVRVVAPEWRRRSGLRLGNWRKALYRQARPTPISLASLPTGCRARSRLAARHELFREPARVAARDDRRPAARRRDRLSPASRLDPGRVAG